MIKAKANVVTKYLALLFTLFFFTTSCFQPETPEQVEDNPYDLYEGVGEIGTVEDEWAGVDQATILKNYDEAYAALGWRERMQVEQGRLIFNGTEFSIVPQFHMSP